MRMIANILNKIHLRKAQPAITRRQAMQVRPLRNPHLEWEHNEEGNVVATLTRRVGLRGKILTFFLSVPEARPVVLDEVGSFVWDMCDGEHSVEDITEALCSKHNLSRREVEISLNEYMRILGKRGMIVIAVPQEIMAELSEETKRALGIQDLAADEEASAALLESAQDAENNRQEDQGTSSASASDQE